MFRFIIFIWRDSIHNNSQSIGLSVALSEVGKNVLSVDYCVQAIEMMRVVYPKLRYEVMDTRDLSMLADSSFDGIVDKGMLDALYCGNDATKDVNLALGEIHRVLRSGRCYILVSVGDPKNRLPQLCEFDWIVSAHQFRVSEDHPETVYSMFACRKVLPKEAKHEPAIAMDLTDFFKSEGQC